MSSAHITAAPGSLGAFLRYNADMSSVFTKIINGELPSHKVYEDDKTFAFLDIHPVQPGHTLVVPKVEVDHLEDLDDETYVALMRAARKVMKHMRAVLKVNRVCLLVEGFEAPHVHVKLIPCNEAADLFVKPDTTKEPDRQALAKMAKRLAL